jgi:hypothetical protein
VAVGSAPFLDETPKELIVSWDLCEAGADPSG